MVNVAHVLSPPMVTVLAMYFRDLDPKSLPGAPSELAAVGKKIYQEGISDTDVPPCASCHGVDAKGQGAFPRFAGRLRDQVLKELVNWSKERGQAPAKPDTSAITEPIEHG